MADSEKLNPDKDSSAVEQAGQEQEVTVEDDILKLDEGAEILPTDNGAESEIVVDSEQTEEKQEEMEEGEPESTTQVDEPEEPITEDVGEANETHEGDGEHDDEEEEEEDGGNPMRHNLSQDPNTMPQVNVSILAQRFWQVKVYPLKPHDFVNGRFASVFTNARESLLYILSPGRHARGKAEMYLSSLTQAIEVVRLLMNMEFLYPEMNIEIIRKFEGVVKEKAYLRFTSGLTQVLTARNPRRLYGGNRKRDRMIGSVFLKNLPPGTTKDMLRVMFPFAQEVNYNPEKFKECTARLVLKNRNHVNPCLKAFAKCELGGNVLELHPISKRKISQSEEDAGPSNAKQRRTNEEGEKASDGDKPKPANPNQNRSVLNRPKPNSSATGGPPSRNKPPQKNKMYRSRVNKAKARAAAFTYKSRQELFNLPKLAGPSETTTRSFVNSNRNSSSNTRGGRRDSTRSDNSRGRSGQRGYRSNERMNQSGYRGRSGNLGVPPSLATSDISLAANTEATKEMMLLQNQLQTAIKSQLAMLNQTTLAVEQAKRGAASVGIGEYPYSMARSSSHDSHPSRGRSIDQFRYAAQDDQFERLSRRDRTRQNSNRDGNSRSGGSGSARGNAGGGRGGFASGGRGGGFTSRGVMGRERDGSNSSVVRRDAGDMNPRRETRGRGTTVGMRSDSFIREGRGAGRDGSYAGSMAGLSGGGGAGDPAMEARPKRKRVRTRRGRGQRAYQGQGSSGGYGNMPSSQYVNQYMAQVDYGYTRDYDDGYGNLSSSSYRGALSSFF